MNFKSVGIRRKPRKKQLFDVGRGNVNLSRDLRFLVIDQTIACARPFTILCISVESICKCLAQEDIQKLKSNHYTIIFILPRVYDLFDYLISIKEGNNQNKTTHCIIIFNLAPTTHV